MAFPLVAAKIGGRMMARRGGRTMAKRGMAYARSPQGRQMAQRGMNYARSPQARQNMERMRAMRRPPNSEMRSMAKGGKVRKTGVVYLHKGERVVPANKVKMVEKGLRNMGINMRLPKSSNTVKVPVKLLATTQLRNLVRIGGKVMKTGPHKVSKGQRVIPSAKVSNVNKILRRQ
tara:strand:+ start:10733 stop:11257 length:525 start_codon:yes stop_codon:yes gene_type:complete